MQKKYLRLEESVAAFGLLWVVEPFNADIHGAVPRLPETDDSADVRDITSRRDKHCTVTQLQQRNTNIYTNPSTTSQHAQNVGHGPLSKNNVVDLLQVLTGCSGFQRLINRLVVINIIRLFYF